MKYILNLLFLFVIYGGLYAQIEVDKPPYNAVGDGFTDDRDAIQEAIEDLRKSGGELKFTSGKTYIISKGLNFYSFSNVNSYLITTTGKEKATIRIRDKAPLSWGYWGFRLSESNNITINNIVIDGNRATRSPQDETSGTDVVFIDGASNGTRLINVDMVNSPMDNVYITVHNGESMMTDFEMSNCKLENAFRNNMSVISGANFKITGCEFINANGTAPQAGIDFEPNDGSEPYSNITVEGCLFKDNKIYGLMLTYIVDGSGDCIVKNNTFENNGLLIASKGNKICNNIFMHQDHNHQHGDEVRDGIVYFHTGRTSTDNEVYNNYFYDNIMPQGSHLINFMYNSGGNNYVHDNFAYGNVVDDFVIDNTKATTPPQIIRNNTFLSDKKMGYWNMDSVEIHDSIVNDLSDFKNNGTNHNARLSPGIINQAMDFSPDNRYVEVPCDSGSLNIEMNLTLIAWIKWHGISDTESEQFVLGKGTDWGMGISNDGELCFVTSPLGTVSGLKAGKGSVVQNVWKMIAATYDGRNIRLFVDGKEEVNKQAYGSLGISEKSIYIGSLLSDHGSFNGLIDEVMIYNYALSNNEIEHIYNEVPLLIRKTDNKSKDHFKIYPNPVMNTLFVETDVDFNSLEIINEQGVIVDVIENKQTVYDLSGLPQGVYFIRFIQNENMFIYKILKTGL